ncbi:MAG: DUF3823 domain-containing protein [Candidatus Cryptobacteroides sp.]
MKLFSNIKAIMLLTAGMALVGCMKDNYDGPDAQIYGKVIDAETGELIQQDLSSGSMIVFNEHGWENPEDQRMNFKVDGTYRNNLMFSGVYDFFFEVTNFVIPEKMTDVKIKKGENELNFEVIPYIRVSDVDIKAEGTKVKATFSITPTGDFNVNQVGLFGHPDYIVGYYSSDVRATQDIRESFKGQKRTYSFEVDCASFKNKGNCWFRVGAIADVPNSRYNYAPGVSIKF